MNIVASFTVDKENMFTVRDVLSSRDYLLLLQYEKIG